MLWLRTSRCWFKRKPDNVTSGKGCDHGQPRKRNGILMDADYRLIDVCHIIEDGMVTYKGLPVLVISDHLTRERSKNYYEPGTELQIGWIEMVASTGRYTH